MRSTSIPLALLLTAALGIQSAGAAEPSVTPRDAAANGRIAFGMSADDNVDVYSVLPDGTDLVRLTDAPGFDACPDWSTDGATIVYCSGGENDTYEIWEMAADGSGKRQVTSMGGAATFPDLSPDGSRIVFDAVPAGGETPQVYLVARDGGDPIALTSEGANMSPVWAPNGERIAFESDRTGTSQIWVMAADGSAQTQLTSDDRGHGAPEWSPDGSRLAFVAVEGDVAQVWVMNADGSDAVQLTSDPAGNAGPAWSPDGQQIAFMSWRHDPRAVYVMRADGTQQTPLAPGNFQLVPSWQPIVPAGRDGVATTLDAGPWPEELLGSYLGEAPSELEFTFLRADDPVCVQLVSGAGDCYTVTEVGRSPADALEYGLVGSSGERLVFLVISDPIADCRGARVEFDQRESGDEVVLTPAGIECHGGGVLTLRRK